MSPQNDPIVEALRALVKREGGYKAVADRAKVSAAGVDQIIKGVLLPSGNPRGVGPKLRAALTKAYPDWLSTVIESKPVAAHHDEDPLPEGIVEIRESSVRFSAGNGCHAVFEEIGESVPVTYRREWFIQERLNPHHCRRFKVHGSSMESLLFDQDSVLVNLAETDVIDSKVYAIRYGNELRVKRLYKRINGGLILHSDNENYRPRDEELTPEEVNEHITIIGRVRDKAGKGGL